MKTRIFFNKLQNGTETSQELALISKELDEQIQQKNPLCGYVEKNIVEQLFPFVKEISAMHAEEYHAIRRDLDKGKLPLAKVLALIHNNEAIITEGRISNNNRGVFWRTAGQNNDQDYNFKKMKNSLGDIHEYQDPERLVDRLCDFIISNDEGSQVPTFTSADGSSVNRSNPKEVIKSATGLMLRINEARKAKLELMQLLAKMMNPALAFTQLLSLLNIYVDLPEVEIPLSQFVESVNLDRVERLIIFNFSMHELCYLSLAEELPKNIIMEMANPGILEISTAGIEIVDFAVFDPAKTNFNKNGFVSEAGILPENSMHGKTGITPGATFIPFRREVVALLKALAMANVDYDLLLEALLSEADSSAYQRGVSLLVKTGAINSIKELEANYTFLRLNSRWALPIQGVLPVVGLLERVPSFLLDKANSEKNILIFPYEAGVLFVNPEKKILDVVPYHRHYLHLAKQYLLTYSQEADSINADNLLNMKNLISEQIVTKYKDKNSELPLRNRIVNDIQRKHGTKIVGDSATFIIKHNVEHKLYVAKFSFYELTLLAGLFESLPAPLLKRVQTVVMKHANSLSIDDDGRGGEYAPQLGQVSIFTRYVEEHLSQLFSLEHALGFLRIVLHEIGHSIYGELPATLIAEFRLISGWNEQGLNSTVPKELLPEYFLTQYAYSTSNGSSTVEEDFCEHFSCFILAPEALHKSKPLKAKNAFYKKAISYLLGSHEFDNKAALFKILAGVCSPKEIRNYLKQLKAMDVEILTTEELVALKEKQEQLREVQAQQNRQDKEDQKKQDIKEERLSEEILREAIYIFGQYLKYYNLSVEGIAEEIISQSFNYNAREAGFSLDLDSFNIRHNSNFAINITQALFRGAKKIKVSEIENRWIGLAPLFQNNKTIWNYYYSQIEDLLRDNNYFGKAVISEQEFLELINHEIAVAEPLLGILYEKLEPLYLKYLSVLEKEINYKPAKWEESSAEDKYGNTEELGYDPSDPAQKERFKQLAEYKRLHPEYEGYSQENGASSSTLDARLAQGFSFLEDDDLDF